MTGAKIIPFPPLARENALTTAERDLVELLARKLPNYAWLLPFVEMTPPAIVIPFEPPERDPSPRPPARRRNRKRAPG
jgi:hypothetical protein